MIGLVIGQVDFEEVELGVDGLGQSQFLDEGVDDAEAAVDEAAERSPIS